VIHELAEEGRSMVLVTHEIRFARDVADHIVFLGDGQVVEEGPPDEVIKAPKHERLRAFLHQIHEH
jgi:polar amino acid transport system ATP-binding protein